MSSSSTLFALLALSLFAAAATASAHPAPYAATATVSSHPSPYAATATASFHPSPYAATATAPSCTSPHAATATASPRPSPQGHPPALETMEEVPAALEEEDGGGAEERYLLSDLQHLMRDSAAAKTNAARMEHLGDVLQLLGFREMAALVPSLAVSPILAAWPGPLTVFAVPDEALEQPSCQDCWMGALLAEHVALGSFTYTELSSKREMKVAAAMVGFCFTASAPSSSSNVSIDGVNISRPDLYTDDRLVVHGMEGPVILPSQGSCYSARILSKLDILRLLVRLLR